LKLEPFTKTDIQLEHGDCLYSFSDGFQDQFGYETKKKFLSKKLRELLFEVHELPMEEQRRIIEARYLAWRGPKDNQTDDMVLFGLRV
jgi:serine phosphatase RsbU (regulator of sigma subunit)